MVAGAAMQTTPHILFVEDDREISALVARYLRDNDFRVSLAADGKEMQTIIEASRVDLVILDLMLPGEDGFTLCRRLRDQSGIPIIILTAKHEEIDRVIGLEMGADDYVTKPFSPRELLARVKAILRRVGSQSTLAYQPQAKLATFEGWKVDLARRIVENPQEARIAVTDAEFDLLRVFCERPGRVLSRDQLLEMTQGRTAGPFERSIDILVSRLRRKIEPNPQEPEYIRTVRSGGYMFTPEVALT